MQPITMILISVSRLCVALTMGFAVSAMGLIGATANAQSNGWKAEWEKTLAAARKEGEVVVYCTPSRGHRKGLAKFRDAYPGIKLTLLPMRVPKFEARISRERKAGIYGFDVYVAGVSSTVYTRQIPSGRYDPLKPAIILPEVLDDSKWGPGPVGDGGFDAGFTDKQRRYTYAMSWNVSQNIYVNYAHLPKGLRIEKPIDLLDPRLKGKMVWLDPRMRQAGSSVLATLMLDLSETQTIQLLTAQKPVITRNGRQLAEWVARGRYPVGLGVNHSNIFPFLSIKGVGDKIEYAPIKFAGPSIGGLMLFNRAPHPNAAKIYINWLLSRAGQAIWSKDAKRLSRRLDVPPGDPDPKVRPKPGEKYFSPNVWQTAASKRKAMKLAEKIFGK